MHSLTRLSKTVHSKPLIKGNPATILNGVQVVDAPKEEENNYTLQLHLVIK